MSDSYDVEAFQDHWKRIGDELAAPFNPAEVKFRVNQVQGKRGLALAYIDARNVMDRLDAVVGPGNWTNVIDDHGTTSTCSISIYCPFRDKWIHKTDGAGDTKVEAEKGRISDAFKRAAVHWGIARYLYSLESRWVELEGRKIPAHELAALRLHLEEVTSNFQEFGTLPVHEQTEVEAPAPRQESAFKAAPPPTSDAQARRQTAQKAQSNVQPITEKQARMLFAKARTAGESRSVHGYRVIDDALESVGLPRTPRGEDIKEHVFAVMGKNYMDSVIAFIDSYGDDDADDFRDPDTSDFEDRPDDTPPF